AHPERPGRAHLDPRRVEPRPERPRLFQLDDLCSRHSLASDLRPQSLVSSPVTTLASEELKSPLILMAPDVMVTVTPLALIVILLAAEKKTALPLPASEPPIGDLP